MISSHFTVGLARAWLAEFPRVSDARGLEHPRAEPGRTATAERTVALRLASPDDQPALGQLAALDSSKPPAPPVLLAHVDGQLLAALALSDGSVVADPFHATADLVDLLRARAGQLDGADQMRRPRRLRSWARLRTAGGC
jgi:hypothetical protein